MTNTQTRLENCFSAVFPDLEAGEIPRARMVTVPAWDSMTTVTLLILVEEEFGVRVSPEEISQFISFEAILEYLENLGGSP